LKETKQIVVLTGAGISAESGLKTFRDADGLWEGHDVTAVASPEGWYRDQKLVLDFYNQRRKQALSVAPNAGHQALAQLEDSYKVSVITQNVDNLHERAGSANVLHLHGELSKVRSTIDEELVYELDGWELKRGDLCEKGSQLRPHIVWFGEAVPMMNHAADLVQSADLLMVVGTSLQVYPAAGLINFADRNIPIIIVDPFIPEIGTRPNLHMIEAAASIGVPKAVTLIQMLLSER
jgi:NAD-dependent deacetylase